MSLKKPTQAELAYWENILNPGRKPAEPNLFYQTTVDDSVPDPMGPSLPAQPARNGGLLWRERAFTNWHKQERKRRPRVEHVCVACGKRFNATARAKHCSSQCKKRLWARAARAICVDRNLPIHSEGETK